MTNDERALIDKAANHMTRLTNAVMMPTKQAERTCGHCHAKLERKRINDRLEDFGVFCRRRYCDRRLDEVRQVAD